MSAKRNGFRRGTQKYSPLEEHSSNGALHTDDDDGDDEAHLSSVSSTTWEKKKRALPKTSWREDYWIDLAMFGFFLQISRKDFGKQKLQFGLGLISCTFVVMIVSLLLSMISNSPIIFQRLSELQDGEIDLRITVDDFSSSASPSSSSLTLNFTELSIQLQRKNDSDQFSYTSPRFEFDSVSFYSYKRCLLGFDAAENRWQYQSVSSEQPCNPDKLDSCFEAVCGSPQATSALLFAIDQQREQRMELGRDWKVVSLLENEVALQKRLARLLHAEIGDTIFARLNSSVLLPRSSETYSAVEEIVYIPLKVAKIFDYAQGKHGSGLEQTAIIEFASVPRLVAARMNPRVPNATRDQIARVDPYQYAPVIVANLPPSRTAAYLSFDEQRVTDSVSAWAGEFVYRAGFPQLNVKLPVLAQLQLYNLFGLFLSLILDVIVFILMFLSILLIYSLLMTSVETKTFETGVMRMLGMSRVRIVQLLLLQSMCFAVPALVLGLLGGQALQSIVAKYMSSLTGVQISAALTTQGVLMATALGIFMPAIASVLPILAALQQNLAEALDSNRSKAKAIEYHVSRSETSEADWAVMLVGSGIALFGFAINYLFPLALVTLNLSLLGNIFLGLLMGMLFGLVLLAVNIQNLLEKFVVFVSLSFWEQPAICALVLKNLSAHRRRNRKTSVMYALSLGFIIFLSIYAAVNLSSFEMREQRKHGSYIAVESLGSLDEEVQRDLGAVRASFDARGKLKVSTRAESSRGYRHIQNPPALEQMLISNPHVASFAWRTAPLRDVSNRLVFTELMNLGQAFVDDVAIVGLQPEYPSAVLSHYFEINERLHRDLSVRGLFEQLYSSPGSGQAFVSTFTQNRMGATVNSDALLHLMYSSASNDSDRHVRIRPLAVFDAFPGLLFTRVVQSTYDQTCAVSLTTWLRLSAGEFRSIDEIPMKTLVVKMRGRYKQGAKEAEEVKSALRQLITDQEGVYLYDYDIMNDRIATSNLALTFIFQFTTAAAMLICFFSLISSMYTSVYEQRKEIGILLSLGLPRAWLTRAFIEEAFVIVLTSSLLGLMIGLVISWTISLQRSVMIALPFVFPMPWLQIALMISLSVLFAFLSSLGSIRQITRTASIVSIMKQA